MIEFFIKRRILANMLSLLIIGLGAYRFITVNREAFPEVKFEAVAIIANYPQASAEEVERLVTQPIEEALKSVSRVDRVESSSGEGRCLIIARLDIDSNKQEITDSVNNIQQAINRIPDLPKEVKTPLVYQMAADFPLLTVSVTGGQKQDRDRWAQHVTDLIEDIPGVSKVDEQGKQAKEILVEVNPQKLAQYQISLDEIARTLNLSNVSLSAGAKAFGTKDILIRTDAAYESLDDIRAVVVRSNDARRFVRVGDIALVRETFADADVLTRANGKPSIALMIKKKKHADTINIVKAIRELTKTMEVEAGRQGIGFVFSDDWAFLIQRRLNVMKSNIIQGGILILIALFVFLDWRLALVAAWGVPISFAAAMALLTPLGLTINMISLLAFIIVLGMLDDDSVVVAENIYRHMEMGKPPAQAAIEGSREVILPVLGSVAAASAAFIPFALAKGMMGKILFLFPLIVIACFAASVFEAFFILPGHVLDVLPLGKPVEKNPSGWQVRFAEKYKRALSWCVANRYRFALTALAFFVLSLGVAKWRLKIIMFPPGIIDQFFVNIKMPEGAALTATEEKIKKIEKVMLKLPPKELDNVVSVVGQSLYEEHVMESLRQGTNLGLVVVSLIPQEKRKRKTDVIVEEVRRQLSQIPDLPKFTINKIRFGPPVGKAVEMRVRGDDSQILKTIAEEVKSVLAGFAGVSDIKDSFEGGKTELRVKPKALEMAYASVNNLALGRQVLYSFGGAEVTKIKRATEEVPVKLKLASGQPLDSFSNLYITNERGQQVKVSPLVFYEKQKTPEFIEHYNNKRVVTITADVDNETITSHEANERLKALFKNLPKKHPGYSSFFGGEEEKTQESLKSLKIGFLIAFVLILIILATLFNSYVQPFIIALTIPIGLVGIAWALILHGKPASFMALMGGVAMTGVVVNNAIVLVDLINRERKKAKSLENAVIEASVLRLRPICASSLTTLLGLFPTAYGFGGFEPFVAPICLTLAWGLAFAMPLTLFVIPVATLIVEDVKQKFFRG